MASRTQWRHQAATVLCCEKTPGSMQPNRQAETTPTHVHQSLMHYCVRCNGVGGRHEQFQVTCLSLDQKLYASVMEHRRLFNVVLGLSRKGGLNRCDYRPHETYSCIRNCAQGRLFNRGDGKVAACSISMATWLSLDDCLYKCNIKKYIWGGRAQRRHSLHSRPIQQMLSACVSEILRKYAGYFYLTMFLLATKQDRIWYFCLIWTQFVFSRQNCNNISQCNISQRSVRWETYCLRRTDKLTNWNEALRVCGSVHLQIFK
jgi:hypothetical protein